MFLCDVGNTNIHFYKDGISYSKPSCVKNLEKIEDNFYYICVNENLREKLSSMENAIDLEPFFDLDTIYEGLGVDRVATCVAVSNGIIVDAGTAITVDIMSNDIHLGGYVLPGITALQDTFKRISPKLNKRVNPNINLDIMPQNTSEAISYGAIKPIIKIIEESKKDKKIYFTGGDGKFFAKFFDDSIYDNTLVFKGMLKTIKRLK